MLAFGNVMPRISCARLLAATSDDDAAATDEAAARDSGKAIWSSAADVSSVAPAGNLPALRTYAATSMACCLDTLPGCCGGIVFSILSTSSASERLLHTDRKALPVSGGPTMPWSASPWQVTHDVL